MATMECAVVTPTVTSYNAAIYACDKRQAVAAGASTQVNHRAHLHDAERHQLRRCQQWQQTLALTFTMVRAAVTPNVISYDAAISACGKGQQ